MELWLLVGVLWLLECLTYFPPGAAQLGWSVRRPPLVELRAGLGLLLPWPLRFAAVLDGIPFELSGTSVSARGALSLFSATAGMEEERVLPLGALAPEAVGAQVRTRAGALLRASSDVAAARLARWLAEIERTPEESRSAAFRALWQGALEPAAARADVERARRVSAPLRVLASCSLAGIALGMPGLVIATGTGFGAAWDLAWRPLLGLHAATFLALVVAEWRLRAAGAGLRLFRALAYPPSLWRASIDQASALLGRHHPFAVAAALLTPAALETLARRALAECAEPAVARPGQPSAADLAQRRAVLEELFAGAGLSAERLATPPKPRTPHAASYCPICQSEFVVGSWTCPECRVEAQPF